MTDARPAGVRQATSAGLWSALDLLFRQGFQFAVAVVLARLLTPADFGLIALLTFFTSLSIMFVQGGLATALIQARDTSIEEESAVFWANMVASIAFAAGLLALAGPLARFYAQPLLQPLMGAAAAQIVLSAAGAVHGSILSRHLRFQAMLKAGIWSSLVSGAAGIGAALAGWGVWALAVQMVTAAGVSSAALWVLSGWRPILHLRLASLKRLFGFGSWLSLSSAVDVLYTQGFSLLLGKLYGVRELGLYNRAISTQALPTNILSLLIGRVALPLFAARTDDPEAVRRGVRLALGVAMLANAPAMVGLSLLSAPVIAVLFGDQWLPAAPILAILALAGALLPLHVINLQVLLAHGGSARFFQLEIAKKAVGIACIVAGSFFGVIGLAWGQFAASVLSVFLNAWPMGSLVGYGAWRQLRDLAGLTLPLGAMTGAVLAVEASRGWTPGPLLAVSAVVGGLAYGLTGLLLRLRPFTDALTLVRTAVGDVLARRRASAQG